MVQGYNALKAVGHNARKSSASVVFVTAQLYWRRHCDAQVIQIQVAEASDGRMKDALSPCQKSSVESSRFEFIGIRDVARRVTQCTK